MRNGALMAGRRARSLRRRTGRTLMGVRPNYVTPEPSRGAPVRA